MSRDLTFPKQASPHLAISFHGISQDPEQVPGSTTKFKGPKDLSITTTNYTRILAKDNVYRIKIRVGTYLRIQMRYSDYRMLVIELLVI
jgi:hypothetical protein